MRGNAAGTRPATLSANLGIGSGEVRRSNMASAGKGAGAALLLAVVASLPLSAAAAKADFGKYEYDSHCAVCHGQSGKGDGPYASLGDRDQAVANLTTLAKRNGGVFPFQRVYETIDGTVAVKAHGTSDMPIWGQRYRAQAGEVMFDVPYDPEVYVRTRILALTEYLSRLQAK
jgi:mono/diheme cytochrome c family protein